MSDIVIYDTEATDADPRHGQITQFGALRTDGDLRTLDQCDLKVRRLPWVVPSPQALAVTGQRAGDLDASDRISEYEATGEIEKFLVPGYGAARTMITYNGIRFDDEMIRTTLFRNLRNPWFSSGKLTTKLDLLAVVRLAHAVRPDAVVVPKNEDGTQSWKLDRVCPANGIEIDAHDALGDARATRDLAVLVRDRAPGAWAAALHWGLPSRAESLLEAAASTGKPMYLFTHFGKPEIIPVAPIGSDGRKKWILADLRADTRPSDAEGIAASMFSKGTPFPVIRSNAAPLFVDAATAAVVAPDIDPAAIAARSMSIKLDKALKTNAILALNSATYESDPSATSEDRIYGGFPPNSDKPLMTAFHRARTWEERMTISFEDPRLADFAARILVDAAGRGEAYVPEAMLVELEGKCSEAMARPHAGPGARWVTIASASDSADEDWVAWSKTAFGTPRPLPECPVRQDSDQPPGAQLEMSL